MDLPSGSVAAAVLASRLSGDTTEVTVFVEPGCTRREAGRSERWAQRLVLVPAQLGQEPAPGPKETGGASNDPANQIETVVTAVEGESGFVALDIGWQKAEFPGWDIGRHGRDEVEHLGPQRLAKLGNQREHAIASGAQHGSGVDIDAHDGGRGNLCHEVGGDGARTGAKVDSPPAVAGEKLCSAVGQLFTLVSGDIYARVDVERLSAELHGADDPGQGFTPLAAADPPLERVVVGCSGHELLRFFIGCDAAGRHQPIDHRCDSEVEDRHRHSVTTGSADALERPECFDPCPHWVAGAPHRSDDEVSFWRGSTTQNTHPRSLRPQPRHDRSALRGATVPTFEDAGGPVVSAGAGGAELADQLSLGGVQVSG